MNTFIIKILSWFNKCEKIIFCSIKFFSSSAVTLHLAPSEHAFRRRAASVGHHLAQRVKTNKDKAYSTPMLLLSLNSLWIFFFFFKRNLLTLLIIVPKKTRSLLACFHSLTVKILTFLLVREADRNSRKNVFFTLTGKLFFY